MSKLLSEWRSGSVLTINMHQSMWEIAKHNEGPTFLHLYIYSSFSYCSYTTPQICALCNLGHTK
jgi:hypothetical protein